MTLRTRIERLERQRRSGNSITVRIEADEHGRQWLTLRRQYLNGDQLTIRLPEKLPLESWLSLYGK